MAANLRLTALLGLVVAAALGGCGGPSTPTGVATNPPLSSDSGSPGGSPSPSAQTGGVRTVLSFISLNVRNGPSRAAAIVGSAARGTELTVLNHVDDNGGWYQVRGATTTGWITADPDLTAPGHFQEVTLDDKMFSALYPADWTYVNGAGEAIFKPQNGSLTIVVRAAATLAGLGAKGLQGYQPGATDTVVACGYTGDMGQYANPAATTPQPTTDPGGGQVTRLASFAQLRLKLDSSHYLALEYNYSTHDQLQLFRDFYNGITVPFSQCMQVSAATPTPAAPPS